MAQPARLASRMQRELRMLQADPPPGVCAWPVQDSFTHLQAQIQGPQGTVYANGIFKLDIEVPDRYPFEPPSIRFITRVYHPNIDSGGRICLDILNLPPKGAWRPSLNLSTLLASIGLLLAEPNPDDGLMGEITAEYKHNRPSFDAKARKWTELYATGDEISENATVAKPQGVQDSVTEDSDSKLRSSNNQNMSVDACNQVPKRHNISLSKKLTLDRKAQINPQPEVAQPANNNQEVQSKGLSGDNRLQSEYRGNDSMVICPQHPVPGNISKDISNVPVDVRMTVAILDEIKVHAGVSKPLSGTDIEMQTRNEKPKAQEGRKFLCLEKENKAPKHHSVPDSISTAKPNATINHAGERVASSGEDSRKFLCVEKENKAPKRHTVPNSNPTAKPNAIINHAGERVASFGDDSKTVNVCPSFSSRGKSLKLSRTKSEPQNVCDAKVQQVKVSKPVVVIPHDAVMVLDSGSDDDDDPADEGFLSLSQRNYGNKRKAGSIRR